MTAVPWRALPGPLTPAQRRDIAALAQELRSWARTLGRWPALRRRRSLPEHATPFVSLYREGRLEGCYGYQAGGRAERFARAFLAAAHDRRYGGSDGAVDVVVLVSYLRDIQAVPAGEVASRFEPGTHGLGLLQSDRHALLLPQVARDGGLDGPAMIARLLSKAGLGDAAAADLRFFLFETEQVVVRPGGAVAGSAGEAATDRAAAWLAGLVERDGRVVFSVDARTRRRELVGPLHHGRAAMLVRALTAHGGHPAVAARASAWLAAEIRRALRGEAVAGWPAEVDRKAGTLALAILAGLDEKSTLQSFLRTHPEVAASPWHAGQCVTALGPEAPGALWSACVADLTARPWAPWTALAATARGERGVLDRCARALTASIRESGPHRGGAAVTAVPEIALTAVSAEGLAAVKGPAATAARRRARAWLARWQLTRENAPAPLDPTLAAGAFPASPVSYHLRSDITAHALLALLGARGVTLPSRAPAGHPVGRSSAARSHLARSAAAR
jgi:AMMECR1 domain-containing protein